MKIIYYSIILILMLAVCPSCNKEVKNLQDEIKILQDENNFLKAENIALKKEVEELYKKIGEKDFFKQKPVATEKEGNLNKETTSKKSDKVKPDKIKQPENGETGR